MKLKAGTTLPDDPGDYGPGASAEREEIAVVLEKFKTYGLRIEEYFVKQQGEG